MKIAIVIPTLMILLGLNLPAMADECVFPNSNKSAPLWVCDAPVEGVALGAVGSMRKSGAGISFTKQMAITSARVQLVQQLRVQVANTVKQYVESTGAASSETVDRVNSSDTKQITNETLQGTKTFKSIVAPDGTMYVLVGLDEASSTKLTEAAVKAAIFRK